MDPLHNLTLLFEKFPGIGSRQARRFVYFLLTQNKTYIHNILQEIKLLGVDVAQCEKCLKFFAINRDGLLCEICINKNRNSRILMIVSRDEDLSNIEKSYVYNGNYFVVGGVIPILEKEPDKKIKLPQLISCIEDKCNTLGLDEVILGMNATPDGEYTSDYIRERILPLSQKFNFIITTLGRGLSTGTEIEYSDKSTIKNAFEHRTKVL